MNPVEAVVVYVVLWWLAFFMVLPIGIRRSSDSETGRDSEIGNDPGAPANPRLGRRALATTGVATLLFALVYWAFEAGLVPLHRVATG